MKRYLLLAVFASFATSLFAQAPVTPAPDQAELLKSSNKQLAQNKKLVYDFWRSLLEAGHTDMAEQFLTEGYIQHNPNVPNGRKGFVDFFSRFPKHDIKPTIQRPLVAIVAEGDLVVMAFVENHSNPSDKSQLYTTTGFDMFRIEKGKIAEHWDGQTMMGKPPQ